MFFSPALVLPDTAQGRGVLPDGQLNAARAKSGSATDGELGFGHRIGFAGLQALHGHEQTEQTHARQTC